MFPSLFAGNADHTTAATAKRRPLRLRGNDVAAFAFTTAYRTARELVETERGPDRSPRGRGVEIHLGNPYGGRLQRPSFEAVCPDKSRGS